MQIDREGNAQRPADRYVTIGGNVEDDYDVDSDLNVENMNPEEEQCGSRSGSADALLMRKEGLSQAGSAEGGEGSREVAAGG